jgi:hypothetical protein
MGTFIRLSVLVLLWPVAALAVDSTSSGAPGYSSAALTELVLRKGGCYVSDSVSATQVLMPNGVKFCAGSTLYKCSNGSAVEQHPTKTTTSTASGCNAVAGVRLAP